MMMMVMKDKKEQRRKYEWRQSFTPQRLDRTKRGRLFPPNWVLFCVLTCVSGNSAHLNDSVCNPIVYVLIL